MKGSGSGRRWKRSGAGRESAVTFYGCFRNKRLAIEARRHTHVSALTRQSLSSLCFCVVSLLLVERRTCTPLSADAHMCLRVISSSSVADLIRLLFNVVRLLNAAGFCEQSSLSVNDTRLRQRNLRQTHTADLSGAIPNVVSDFNKLFHDML